MVISMKKIIRLMAILLIVFLSISSYAAVVSDNDGAAFITKAEYDSLKAEFQAQLNEYNQGIDNKIEDAIANYLAGISTARTLVIKTPVTNYADMRWKRKWDVYGTYVTWTGPSTWTRTTDKWFEPFMDKFLYTRTDNMNIKFYGGRFAGYHIYYIYGKWDYDNASGPIFKANGDSAVVKPSHNIISCKYDEVMGKIVIGDYPFYTVGPMWDRHSSAYRQENMAQSTDNGATWGNVGASSETENPHTPMQDAHPYASHWMTNLPLGEDDVFRVEFVARYQNDASYLCKWECVRKSWELAFNEAYGALYEWDPAGSRYTNSGSGPAVNIKTGSVMNITGNNRLWTENPSGLHSCQLESESTQREDFKYMMLGDNSRKTVYIHRRDPKVTIGSSEMPRIKTEKSDWCVVPVNFERFSVNSRQLWTLDYESNNQVTYSTPVPVSLRVPFQEKATLSELAGGKFYNGQTPLSYGEGLPISTRLYNKGTITVEFDYEISRSIEAVPSGATGIQVDLKKTNFLTNTEPTKEDYFYGKVGTSNTRVKLKDQSIDTTARHAKIVIAQEDVKDTDGLWMRIKPKSTVAGLKAKIKNLDVKMVIE